MWHASTAPLPGRSLTWKYLRSVCLRHLAPVGDREHEWEEVGVKAYHVRRRLTEEEQAAVGEAIDLRKTPEAIRRLEALPDRIRRAVRAFAERGGEV